MGLSRNVNRPQRSFGSVVLVGGGSGWIWRLWAQTALSLRVAAFIVTLLDLAYSLSPDGTEQDGYRRGMAVAAIGAIGWAIWID